MMTETVSPDLDHCYQQAADSLAQGNYQQAATLFQTLIEAEPDVKAHCWHFGLALLLQGEEAEAQTAWMLAMFEGDDQQVAEWTTELISVLETEAERREAVADFTTAWAIRHHLREIAPEHRSNLLHLVRLAVELHTLNREFLTDSGILRLLEADNAAITIDWDLGLQVLKQVLKFAPLEPFVLEFARAFLHHIPEPLPFVYALMDQAIEVSATLHRPLVAVNYAKLCLEVYPNNLNILSQLSYFYQDGHQHAEGIETARTFCTLARSLPDQVFGAFIMLRSLMRAASEWDKIFAIFEHQGTLIEELVNTPFEPFDQSTVFLLTTSTFPQPYIRDSLAQNRLNQNRLMRLCQASVEAYAGDVVNRYQQGFTSRRAQRSPSKPLRIGYVSHCLRQHSVGWLSRWLFRYHDREQFQIYGYFWNTAQPIRDPLQRWFVDHVAQARLLGRDSSEIANQIFADEIDILVDLDSITADISCEVLMRKPAPVQVSWLGWDASGIPGVDYYIADPYVLPGYAEEHYSEKIWRLPQTYLAVDGFEVGVPTLRRELLGIPEDAVVYWSGQSAYKRHPATVRSQLEIIKAVPNSYLLIKGITDATSIQNYFIQLAETAGVNRERLRFLPDVAEEAVHRANLGIADVVLDTYPYNGATTTMETLWVGIPIVTRVGEHFSSRNSYTMMLNAGIHEGIAHSEDEYIEWGIRLGMEPELRQQITWKLWKSRQTSPLWNAQAFTRDMENAYQQMWQTYLRS